MKERINLLTIERQKIYKWKIKYSNTVFVSFFLTVSCNDYQKLRSEDVAEKTKLLKNITKMKNGEELQTYLSR